MTSGSAAQAEMASSTATMPCSSGCASEATDIPPKNSSLATDASTNANPSGEPPSVLPGGPRTTPSEALSEGSSVSRSGGVAACCPNGGAKPSAGSETLAPEPSTSASPTSAASGSPKSSSTIEELGVGHPPSSVGASIGEPSSANVMPPKSVSVGADSSTKAKPSGAPGPGLPEMTSFVRGDGGDGSSATVEAAAMPLSGTFLAAFTATMDPFV